MKKAVFSIVMIVALTLLACMPNTGSLPLFTDFLSNIAITRGQAPAW